MENQNLQEDNQSPDKIETWKIVAIVLGSIEVIALIVTFVCAANGAVFGEDVTFTVANSVVCGTIAIGFLIWLFSVISENIGLVLLAAFIVPIADICTDIRFQQPIVLDWIWSYIGIVIALVGAGVFIKKVFFE